MPINQGELTSSKSYRLHCGIQKDVSLRTNKHGSPSAKAKTATRGSSAMMVLVFVVAVAVAELTVSRHAVFLGSILGDISGHQGSWHYEGVRTERCTLSWDTTEQCKNDKTGF